MRSHRVVVSLAAITFALSACTFLDVRNITWDATRDKRAASVAGRCFETRVDLRIYSAPDKPGPDLTWLVVDQLVANTAGDRPDAPLVPKGSRFVIEFVRATHYPQVGTSLMPFARLDADRDHGLIQASHVFVYQTGDDPLLPLDKYLRSCDSALEKHESGR
jgi:hypothetical protein